MNNNVDPNAVYVDIDALTGWSKQMNQINESSITKLNSLVSTIGDLDNYWKGNLASGFIDDSTSFVESVQRCHNDMKDVVVFLIDVVNIMSNH